MSNNATKIDLYLKNPNGNPRTNTTVIVKPVRAGFWGTFNGIIPDEEIIYETDNNGYVQMGLWPLPYPYYLMYSDDDDSIPGQFLFYVPQVDTVVNFQDLVVTKADTADKYADTVLEQIIAAKVATMAAAAEAKESAEDSEASAEAAAGSAVQSSMYAQTTTEDRNQVEITNGNLLAIYAQMVKAITIIQGIAVSGQLKLGTHTIWVDSAHRLRIMNGTPTDIDTDGVVVGTQS